MRVTVINSGALPTTAAPAPVPAPAGDYQGWRPSAVLGAESSGGLLLPSAMPTAAQLYGPRGVWVDAEMVVVADSGNHRVLIWHGIPSCDNAAADVILGQPDETSEGPAAGGIGPANGMHLPTGIVRDGQRLVIADAWHHRLLIWESLPRNTATPPDRVIGQPDLISTAPNAGGEATAETFYWPFGIALIDGAFYVADTGNRRVLIWHHGVPAEGQAADVVLGQPTPQDREENRGGAAAADSFRWPHAIAADGSGGIWIADAGNHRVLGWQQAPQADTPADRVLGQPDMTTAREFPYESQAGRLRFPYAIAGMQGALAVADTANNRVLICDSPRRGWSPEIALAQPDLSSHGENRWQSVSADSLCWPYGLSWHRDEDRELLAVADSGNNRVVLWTRS